MAGLDYAQMRLEGLSQTSFHSVPKPSLTWVSSVMRRLLARRLEPDPVQGP